MDVAAQYGGEDLCLILPHTDLDGADVIAERVREAIEAAEIPLDAGNETLRVTASFGVAATRHGDQHNLIAAAAAALNAAKREGKNRTVWGGEQVVDMLGEGVPLSEPEA